MKTKKSHIVKALLSGGGACYYSSLGACCREHGIRYEDKLVTLIEEGGIAPDGMTFFDWPTDEEVELIEAGVIRFRDSGRQT